MLRLKAALLIRIISRQRQCTESEGERESGLRAIIIFKRHYEIALANEMHGCARAYAQIEIYWKIENMFSYSCLFQIRPTLHGASWDYIAVHRLTRDGCVQLHGQIRGRLEELFRRRSKSLCFTPARTLFHHRKKHRKHGRQVETLQRNH